MTANQNVREQRPAKTDTEKLFKIAVEELMQVWDNNSENNITKMNSIIHSLRDQKLFPKRIYNKLEEYFRPDGSFFSIKAGTLLYNKGRKVLRLLPVLDAHSEHKILQETCLQLYYYSDALQKLAENPYATLDDLELFFVYGHDVDINDKIVGALKHLWNQEIVKTNGCPGQHAKSKYGVCVNCIYTVATSISEQDERKQSCVKALKELSDIDMFVSPQRLQQQMLINAKTKVK